MHPIDLDDLDRLEIEICDFDLLEVLAYRIATGASSVTLDDVCKKFHVVPADMAAVGIRSSRYVARSSKG